MQIDLNERVPFQARHNASTDGQISQMLDALGLESIEALISQAIPDNIRLTGGLQLPPALNEYEYINKLKSTAAQNKVFKSYIGQGYYGCVVPAVIQRNILENPGWYTAYTPYQAEIAQGRLEVLLNFQTMISDLTGMEMANASLLDEGTAAAEAVSLMYAVRERVKKQAHVMFVDRHIFPQTLEVLQTRTAPLGIDLQVGDIESLDLTRNDLFGIFFQYPDNLGHVHDRSSLVASASEQGLKIGVCADLLSLCVLTPPGEWGADVVVGTTQRLGVPMGYGGPHAAYFATKETYKRQIPGRVIGVSVDSEGNTAYRMALQTREQHIKRERATSNICTAQVLLAVMAGMYTVYHGPDGLTAIARRVHGLAKVTAEALRNMGIDVLDGHFFDTITFRHADISSIRPSLEEAGINLRYDNGLTSVSFDETHTPNDARQLVQLIGEAIGHEGADIKETVHIEFPEGLSRRSGFLEHEVFAKYRTEHELLRYMKRLENKDLSLVHSMISLGSCTMKLNATTEMLPVTWPEFANIHPFAPKWQVTGYEGLIGELHNWLATITGFAAISFEPNSGAQGEYAGLMAIRSYHQANGDNQRSVVLIPSSAHGTNPASAVMAGMKVIIVQCDEMGNIDQEDLKKKAEAHADELAALMVTYPSTHGVYEEGIMDICQIIHKYGGQVYMDGANMNAQVGLVSPASIGADVCHLNLHKTFCIPHGGGGPGMGPIGVASHLAAHLPGQGYRVSSAPYGSASILPISHAYIAMMGSEGLRRATELAILNANYIANKLQGHYPVLYANEKGRNAHELIIDCREFKKSGIEVEDIAKRMMDYGYHAPTVSFPVAGTMMIEPTESETKDEIDRFCEVMISIRKEVQAVIEGASDPVQNVLKNAPHTYRKIMADKWDEPYSRSEAAFPLPYLKANKFWPSVGRIDSAYGDRNLICSCIPVADYEEETVQ